MLEKLNDIKVCPHCGCKEIAEERKYSQHTNGHWNESIKFRCGFTSEFSPNYMSTHEVLDSCTMSKPYQDRINKQRAFKDKLIQFIDGGKIDKEYKVWLKQQIGHL